MSHKPIHELFNWWINAMKSLNNHREYDFIIKKVKFDEQNLPVDNFYRNDIMSFQKNLKETIIDVNPSLSSYFEMIAYDKDGKFLRESIDEITDYILKSEGFDCFQTIISDKWELTEREEDKNYEINYVLENMFISTLQEYSDSKNGISSIFEEKLDHNILNKILDKHINFFDRKYCEVELIFPIVGAIWIKNKGDKDLVEKIEDNMNIRLVTKEEQIGRIYFSETELGIFEKDRDFLENINNINKSNLAISIKEKAYVKDLLNDEHRVVNSIYEKYHLKVNTLLNLFSLNEFEYNLSVLDMYYKCDSYPFSHNASPITNWRKVNTLSRNKIKLLSEEYFYKLTELNSVLIKNVVNEYTKIIKASSGNRERIQGAFLRRTRSKMDLNETEGLLDSIIGIEQLFSSGQSSELTFRISLYVSNILYSTEDFENQTKKNIFTEFKELYKLRSSFVHSGKKVSNERGLYYLTSLLKHIIRSDKINLELQESISEQTQNIYLFMEK